MLTVAGSTRHSRPQIRVHSSHCMVPGSPAHVRLIDRAKSKDESAEDPADEAKWTFLRKAR